MKVGVAVLCALIADPQRAAGLSPTQWTGLIALARRVNLLGTLGERMLHAGVSSGCNADRHLAGARQLSERQRRSVRWEAQAIHDALAELDCPIVLLKGAAYCLGGYPNARGRLFGDIDILVPPDRLADVEIRLMVNGWAPSVTTDYDERYYRKWMHELPPMAHVRRGSVIDVHHTILPPTARLRPNPKRIIDGANPLPELPALRVPCPEDLIIHSIVHLVHEGSVDNGLRDLCDIGQLLAGQAGDPDFAADLRSRAREHGVEGPFSMGMRLVERFFPASSDALPGAAHRAFAPRLGYGTVAESLFAQAIDGAGKPGLRLTLTRLALYVRAHWLRMPPLLLARHLLRKLAIRWTRSTEAPAGAELR
jgi:hypothetical protein